MTFRHLLRRSVLHTESDRRGDLVSRVTSDVTTLEEFMEWGGVGIVIAGQPGVPGAGGHVLSTSGASPWWPWSGSCSIWA